MTKTWVSVTEALRELLAAEGLSYDALAEATGVGKPSLIRFLSERGGLNTTSVDRLLRYFGLVVVEKPKRRTSTKGTRRATRRTKKGG